MLIRVFITMKRILLLLLLAFSGHAFAETIDGRTLGLTTQDKNGFHMVLITANAKAASSSVLSVVSDKPARKIHANYSRERFEKLWSGVNTLDLSPYKLSKETKDLGPADNYIVTIGFGGGMDDLVSMTYLIPKCKASPEIMAFINKLVAGLLPVGSPGLLHPCKAAKTS